MKPSTLTALPLITSGLALCLVSLAMLSTNGRTVATARPAPAPATDETGYSGQDEWFPALVSALPPQPRPEETALPEGPERSPARIARIRAPGVGIDAAIEVKSVDSTGAMENPYGPQNVAWYDFSAQPGTGGNIVMAGHVDYHNYGPAVFWRLRDLRQGDRVEVLLEDGETFVYEVHTSDYYAAATAPVSEIVGATPFETLTMITCGGAFDAASLEYDERLVVKARLVINTATSTHGPH